MLHHWLPSFTPEGFCLHILKYDPIYSLFSVHMSPETNCLFGLMSVLWKPMFQSQSEYMIRLNLPLVSIIGLVCWLFAVTSSLNHEDAGLHVLGINKLRCILWFISTHGKTDRICGWEDEGSLSAPSTSCQKLLMLNNVSNDLTAQAKSLYRLHFNACKYVPTLCRDEKKKKSTVQLHVISFLKSPPWISVRFRRQESSRASLQHDVFEADRDWQGR